MRALAALICRFVVVCILTPPLVAIGAFFTARDLLRKRANKP
jgi:hypothetical protein